jgi:peptidoglycan/xylan/chitin deacetylase (PgdA/CDA1 family)
MADVTIIMYHYVRDLPHTRYPEINGLKVSEFENQLNYLNKHFTFITVEQCMDVMYEKSLTFPDNAVLLTFDDGYKEHFTEVFPILNRRGIQGAFFPPSQAILEHKMLDVNKIHFILATAKNIKKLVEDTHTIILKLSDKYQLNKPEYYRNKLRDSHHRYDSAEIVYIKRLLQREIPETPRAIILDTLFEKYLNINEKVFAKELYMSSDQIKCMHRNGMHIGGHGYSHQWLNTLSSEDQEREIKKTVEFLNYIGVNTERWTMCYPYGAYNQKTIDLLKTNNCTLGLTTQVGTATLTNIKAYTLPRMDTNDFPKGPTTES